MNLKFLALSFAITTSCYSQRTQVIKGILKEQGTDNPVPFGSIGIINSTRGTAANGKGEFLLDIREKDLSEKLRVSCIGFMTRLVPIDSIKGIAQLVIRLEPDISLLDEIVIREAPLNPGEILKKAIESVNDNYLNTPFNMEYYSEIIATDTLSKKEFKIETILNGYSQGYSSFKKRPFEIIHRRTTGEDFLAAIDYDYWPTYEIHRADEISTPYKQGVFNLKNVEKFNLKYSGVSLFDEDTVYNIEYYAPKPNKEITGYGIVPKIYKGNIFIATSTHAIVKHEITTDYFSFLIIYRKMEGKYFPYFISGRRKIHGSHLPVKISNSIVLQSIDTQNVKMIEHKTNELGPVNEVRFEQEFWDAHYPVDKK